MSAAGSIFSEQWYRVAETRPALAAHVRIDRHCVRGATWHVLTGEDDATSVRLDDDAYAVAGRCDGSRTVNEIWDLLNTHCGDDAPTQDDVVQVLLTLHERRWLEFPTPVHLEGLARDKRRQDSRSRWHSLNPIAVRIPLLDLRRWLRPLDGLADRLWSRSGLAAWLLLVGSAGGAALWNIESLWSHAGQWLTTPRYLLLGLCVYPVIKLLHELAHALAIRRWRGEVRQAGITLLAFMPVPYIDASAANRFPRARQRATVSLAGIAAELAIASIAVWLWLWLDNGLLRDLALLSLIIGSVSTVVINANPLLRFDGYFACCDLLGLPNLATRSQRLWQTIVQSRFLGSTSGKALQTAPGERRWLLAYAPLSWCYQVLLAVAITGWVGSRSPVFGMLAAAVFVVLLLGQPLRWLWRTLHGPEFAGRERGTALRRTAVAGGVLLLALAAVPLPDRTTVQGVAWVPEHAILRAAADGFIEHFAVESGKRLRAGQLVAVLGNPALRAREQRLAARIDGLRITLFQAMGDDAAKASQIGNELARAMEEASKLASEIAGLELHTAAAGTLAMPMQDDLLGTYVRRGQTIGYTLTGDRPIVRVAVPQDEVARIRRAGTVLKVRLAADPGTELTATLRQDSGGAVDQLPSAALSTYYGGEIVTSPDDPEHRKTLTPVVMVDVQLDSRSDRHIGERAWVRFDHGLKPVAWQWFRAVDRWRHRHFGAAA